MEGFPHSIEVVKVEQDFLPGSGGKYESPIGFTGILEIISVSYRNGCNGLVEVAAGVKREPGQEIPLVPSKQGETIALNNVVKPYRIDEPVQRGSRLWMDVDNYDAVNSHKITVIGEVRKACQQED